MTAIDLNNAIAWATDNVVLAIATIISALFAAFLSWLIIARLVRRAVGAAKVTGRAAARLDLAAVGAAGVGLLASLASLEAMWEFLRHDLGITDTFVRAVIVVLFDLAAVVAALLSREARVRAPGHLGVDTLLVWAIAGLLGYFAASHAETPEGSVFRAAVPVLAGIMWDRVIARDVARSATLDKARLSTITGRIVAGILRAVSAVWRSIMRTLARLGLVQPDQDIAEIQHARWQRRFIKVASMAKSAEGRYERLAAETPRDEKELKRATGQRDRLYERFDRTVADGLRIGAVTTPEDLESALWKARVALNARDILDQAGSDSPWRIAGRSVDRPIDAEVIDGEVIVRPDPTDRPVDRSVTTVTDRPNEPEPTGTDRPDDRPDDRPTDDTPIEPTDIINRPNRPTGRDLDRPTDRADVNIHITVTTDRETQFIRTLAELVLEQGVTELPSQARLATAAELSKSTVGDIIRRWGIPKQITDEVAAAIETVANAINRENATR